MVSKKKFFFILLLLFEAVANSNTAYGQTFIDNQLMRLIKAKDEDQPKILHEIFTFIDSEAPECIDNYAKKIISITSNFEDKYCFNHALIYFGRFGKPEERKALIRTGIEIAKDRQDLRTIAGAQILLGEIYQEVGHLDSAAILILDARNIYAELNDQSLSVTFTHKLGDLFYSANLLDRAKIYYDEVRRLKGDQKAWFDWRKFVITNNLGLIERKKKNYNIAIQYFNHALQKLLTDKKNILNRADTVRMTRSYIYLAQTYSLKENYDSSWINILKAEKLGLTYNLFDLLTELDLQKGINYFYNSKNDSSIFYLKKAENSTERNINFEYFEKINKYLAYNYKKLGDFTSAYVCLDKSSSYTDSIIKRRNISSVLQLISDDSARTAEKEINEYYKKLYILIAISLIIALSLLTILILYLRLRSANQFLFRKSIALTDFEKEIEELKTKMVAKPNHTENKPTTSNDITQLTEIKLVKVTEDLIGEINLKNIATQFDELVNSKKYYLDPIINLEYLSQELGLNRNLLSKAINTVFKVNFHTYINNLRIKRVISILSDKEAIRNYNLEGISKKAGFANRTSFISAFKLYTGITPSTFVKNLPK